MFRRTQSSLSSNLMKKNNENFKSQSFIKQSPTTLPKTSNKLHSTDTNKLNNINLTNIDNIGLKLIFFF